MATRQIIAVNGDQGVRSIYCHFNGQPAVNGVVLSHYHGTEDKANSVVDFGDMLDIGIKTGHIGSFRKGHLTHSSVEEMMDARSEFYVEYLHLFNDGKWQIHVPGSTDEKSGAITSWKRDHKAEKLVADIIAGKVKDENRVLGHRNSIAIKTDEGVRSIRSHWGAFVDVNGGMLAENYDTPEKIMEIMKDGDILNLGETSDDCRRDDRQKVESELHASVNDWMKSAAGTDRVEMMFLFEGNEWHVFAGGRENGQWKRVPNWRKCRRHMLSPPARAPRAAATRETGMGAQG